MSNAIDAFAAFAAFDAGPQLYGTFVTPPANKQLPKLHVYVDEYGDRSFKANRQSDYFTMTALIVPEEQLDRVRHGVQGLKSMFEVPAGRKLHWVDHFKAKKPGRRRLAADVFGAIPDLSMVHVVLHKPSILEDAHMRQDQGAAYNYVSMLLVERIARIAAGCPGGSRLAKITFGVVGGVDHDVTMRYLHHTATHPVPGWTVVPWGNLLWPFRWADSAAWDGLQAADIYSGMLKAALVDGDHTYLRRCFHQMYRSTTGTLLGYGMKIHPRPAIAIVTTQPWWSACH